MNIQDVYPASPVAVPEGLTQVSSSYKRNVRNVLLSITFFAVVYLLLVLVALGLAWVVFRHFIPLVLAFPHWITIVAGLGMAALCVMVLAFMVRFIFKFTKNENPYRVEVTEEEQPLLFAFIRKVCEETKAPFPHKIYLSPGINAAVFYNSSFFSLFLPVKKNLEIGLGLVNSINLSEFKAVIAHEFGHFSQRSMKLGSYTYMANKVVYDLVFTRDKWDELLDDWARVNSFIAWFAVFTHWIVNGAKWVLFKTYNIVNIRYMALSREMEFHADSVAVSVTGSEMIGNSLERLEFADAAYQSMINELNVIYARNKQVPDNIYDSLSSSMSYLCRLNKLPQEDNLPLVTKNTQEEFFPQSRINFKNLWASHPPTSERKINAQRVNVSCSRDSRSPWILFNKPAELKKKITAHFYDISLPKEDGRVITEASILEKDIAALRARNERSDRYFGFYDNRELFHFDPGKALSEPKERTGFSYSPEVTRRIRCYYRDMNDIETLKNIRSGELKLKTFEFDGQQYKQWEAYPIISKLEKETETEKEWLQKQEELAFLSHYNMAAARDLQLAVNYRQCMELLFTIQTDHHALNDIIMLNTSLYNRIVSQSQWTQEEVNGLHYELVKIEDKFKALLDSFKKPVVPDMLLEVTEGKTYYEYLVPIAPVVVLSKFHFDNFSSFANSVAEVSGRAVDLFNNSLSSVLRLQDNIAEDALKETA